jgi:arylsulfatase A-like enzyme
MSTATATSAPTGTRYPHSPHRSEYFTVWRDGDWKVIYHYQPSAQSENSPYQLFNLRADPFEHKNLAAAEPLELRRLMRGLIAALEKHQAVYPVAKDGKTALNPRLP